MTDSIKPFNIEAARAGAPVKTLGGKKVTQLKIFVTSSGDVVYGVVDGKLKNWGCAGNYLYGTNPKNNLVMA